MVVGDNVVTIGGIVGRVVNLKDDEVTISTSVANTLITFKKSSINTVIKPLSD
jgi:preprotein translocase subunit YajC